MAIGLLMFFECVTARRQLWRLQAAVRPGGVAVINVLVESTTFPAPWQLLEQRREKFEAPGGRLKRFSTVIARRA